MTIILLVISLLCSCSVIPENDAKSFASEYLELLENADFTSLEERSGFIQTDNIEEKFNNLEKDTGVDFQSGIEVQTCEVTHSTHSDSYYGCPLTEVAMWITVGDANTELIMHIISEDGDLKVAKFDINTHYSIA